MAHSEFQVKDLSSFDICEELGSGTFGVVYRAFDKSTKETFALKRLKFDKKYCDRFGFPLNTIREIKVLNNLRNANTVAFFDVVVCSNADKDSNEELSKKGIDAGDIFFQFEFVPFTLHQLLMTSFDKLSAAQKNDYIYQLFTGLFYCHTAGYIHRDIKSENILITKNNVLKIADWGLGRKLPSNNANDPNRLTAGIVTLWYRSPELLLGSDKYGTEIDIWAAGVVVVEILTSRAPFQSSKDMELLNMIYTQLGTPDSDAMLVYQSLPKYKNFPEPPVNRSPASWPFANDANAVELVNNLLNYHPKKRPTSKQVLEYNYFRTGKSVTSRQFVVFDEAEVARKYRDLKQQMRLKHDRIVAMQQKQQQNQQQQQEQELQQQQQQPQQLQQPPPVALAPENIGQKRHYGESERNQDKRKRRQAFKLI